MQRLQETIFNNKRFADVIPSVAQVQQLSRFYCNSNKPLFRYTKLHTKVYQAVCWSVITLIKRCDNKNSAMQWSYYTMMDLRLVSRCRWMFCTNGNLQVCGLCSCVKPDLHWTDTISWPCVGTVIYLHVSLYRGKITQTNVVMDINHNLAGMGKGWLSRSD